MPELKNARETHPIPRGGGDVEPGDKMILLTEIDRKDMYRLGKKQELNVCELMVSTLLEV